MVLNNMKALLKNRSAWLILILLICVILLALGANDRLQDRNERTEDGEHFFLTYTPDTLSQIYSDDWYIRPRKISGELNLPPGDGPFAAVILYHGHYHPDDLTPWFNKLVPRLLEANIATFVIDSFTGRKITSTAFSHMRLSRAARLTDAFQALNMLAKLDEIDEDKIGITGYSVGGTTAMLAANRRLNETSLARGRSFAALMPVYPSCQSRFRSPEMLGAPMLMLLAQDDNYSSSEYCEEFAQEATTAGYDVQIIKYEGAQHGWVNNLAYSDCENCMSFRDCGLTYIEDDGHESALEGKVTTLFGWREYLQTVYRQCGSVEVISRSDAKISEETIEATLNFFSENLL
jgi:dienelactone hydrolase